MVLCQILYVSDKNLDKEKDDKENKEKLDKEKVDKEKVNKEKVDKEKVDKEKVDNEKVDKEKENKEKNKKDKLDKEKFDKVKFDNYSANELAVKLKQIGFDVGEICEDVDFDETQKIIYEKMFLVPEVIFYFDLFCTINQSFKNSDITNILRF
jgi:hypothetical protein